MQQRVLFSMSPREPMSHHFSSLCAGLQSWLSISSRLWCLPTKQPRAWHPPTSILSYASRPKAWGQFLRTFSRTFTFTVPCWWNDLPNSIQTAGSLTIFKKQLKPSNCILLKKSVCFYFSLFSHYPLIPSCPSYFDWWLKPCITGTSCVYFHLMMNRLLYSINYIL